MSQYKKRAKLSTSESSDREGEPWTQSSRAEKSRHAAKMRRDKEGVEIAALAKLLPFPEEITSKLDKGSIIRLTTSYLRMKKFTQKEGDALLDELKQKQQKAITSGEESPSTSSKSQVDEGALMLEALNGFVLFVSRKGRVLYVADNVVKHLGIPQHDMIGNNIVEFIHPDDQKELAKQFIVKRPGQQSYRGYGVNNSADCPLSMEVHFFDNTDGNKANSAVDYVQERSFFMRMRSVTPKKGSSGKGKVIGYRLVQCSGRLKLKSSSNSKGYNVEGLICICRPAQPSPILEIRMDGNMFMSRHNLDMSFTFCDPRIITLVGYEPHELIGKTAYQFHNPLDAAKISSCHSKLIVKGTSISKYYRFLGKNSDWIWMQTRATIIYNTGNEAQYVVCQNYVIGKDEGDKYLLLERMQRAQQSCCSPRPNGDSDDSGIENNSGVPSPCPSGGESSPGYSIYNSPGFMTITEIETMDANGEIETQLIADPVRHVKTCKVVKPKEEAKVSFAGLANREEEINKSKDGKDSVSVMNSDEVQNVEMTDISQEPSTSSDMKCESCDNGQDDNKPDVVRLDSSYSQNGSPGSDLESVSSASDISSVTSPPDMFSFETKDPKTLPIIEDDDNMDENMIKDLLEITKDDYEKDSVAKTSRAVAGSNEHTSVLFTVASPADFPATSPDPKMPLADSPSSVNTNASDSPLSVDNVDNETEGPQSPDSITAFLNSPFSPARQFLDSELSDIVDKLGSEEGLGDPADMFSSILGNNSSPFGFSSSVPAAKVTTIVAGDSNKGFPPGILETTIHRLDTQKPSRNDKGDSDALPDDIAEFSMEFCDKLVDQMAENAISHLGVANIDLTEMPEIPKSMLALMGQVQSTAINTCQPMASTSNAQNVQPIVTSPVQPNTTPVDVKAESEESTPIQKRCPTLFKHLTAQPMEEKNTQKQQGSMVISEQQVTEEISKLDIRDSEKTPLLRALLTGDQANPLSTDKVAGGGGDTHGSLTPTGETVGPLTPMEKQITDTILEMEQNSGDFVHNVNLSALQVENNNIAQQTDLLMLQEQQRQRHLLEQQHKDQQHTLLERHNMERETLEQKLKKQLLLQQLLQQQSQTHIELEHQKLLDERQHEQLQEQLLTHLKEKRQLLQQQLMQRRLALQHQQLQQPSQTIYQQQQFPVHSQCPPSQPTTQVPKPSSNSLLQQFLQQPSQIIPESDLQGLGQQPQCLPQQQQQQQYNRQMPSIQDMPSLNHNFLNSQNSPPQQQQFVNSNPTQFSNEQQQQSQHWQQGLQQQMKQSQQLPRPVNVAPDQPCQDQPFQFEQSQQQYPPPLTHQGPYGSEEQLPQHLSQQIMDYNQQLPESVVWSRQTHTLFTGN